MNFNGNFKRIGATDVAKLKEKVLMLTDDDWLGDDSRQKKFKVHEFTQTIALIFDKEFKHIKPTILPYYYDLKTLVDPISQIISKHYDSSLKGKRLRKKNPSGYIVRMIIVRLLAQGEITPHVDNGYSLCRCHRVHIPLVTSDKTSFTVGDESKNMQEGEIWEINNRRDHSVVNNSDQNRIHLIIDYVLPGERIKDTFEDQNIIA